jgi:type IV pilus assembly protein PilY1
MTVVIPAHPQVLLAIANSQSMDGNLSGAIMTGSGASASGGVLASYPVLKSSSSPVSYTIPSGFTPPVNAGTGGTAPYTVQSGNTLVDNSASRLNVAKQGISSVLAAFISSTDFALMDYNTSGIGLYNTWVYQMSPPGGFTFLSQAPTSGEYVPNPCYGLSATGTDTVSKDCANMASTLYASQNIWNKPYILVSASSDDSSINDVLYANAGIDPVCVTYGGPTPPTPYSAPYTLATYNDGQVWETYSSYSTGCAAVRTTDPTNAGYVPYSTQVLWEERGFGFYTWGQSATSATTLVPMTTSGTTPTAASVATALAAFTPYLQPETNSTSTTEIKAAARQAPMAGLVAGANSFFSKTPSTTAGCSVQRYLVLVTDGLPTMDLNGLAWPPLGSAAATGYGVTATFNANGTLQTTNDQALTDVINQLTALKAAGVKTYIVGLGAGVDAAANPQAANTLTAMAIAGGTGVFLPATSPQALNDDLEAIVSEILAATQSTSAPAVSSTGLNTNSVLYLSQFDTSDAYQDWTGNLFAFPINPTTGAVNTLPSAANWSAQTQLDGQNWSTGRLIATWDPVAAAGTPFEWTTGTPSKGIANSTTLGTELKTFTLDTNGRDVLQYLRGSSGKEQRNGGQFRNRSHTLGDIVNSGPQYVGPPNQGEPSSSYVAFQSIYANRPPVIYVGANDGMLHAFDAATGNERFAYIPTGVYANLIKLVSPYYNAAHQFYVNGSPQSADVQFASNNSWHTLLVGTEAQGGASVFALDISNPAAITSESVLASDVLWDFTDVDMGEGFSTPSINNTAAGWQVFVGNGYDSVNGKPVLYALNPQTGAITSKIDLCAAVAATLPTACNTSVANGLSSVAVVNTGGELTGYANLIYAGDLQGNVWRIDISNATPSNWAVSILFQAKDALGNAQPITTTPAVSLNPRYPQVQGTMVFFGTGELLGTPDLSNTKTQSVYGVYDPPAGYSTPLTRASLVQQTLTAVAEGSTTVDVVTGNAVTIPTSKGWFIDFTLNAGERLVNNPVLQAGDLVLTTYIPPQNVCVGGGNSYFYAFNYATGGSFASPQFDLNGDGLVNSSDSVSVNGVTNNPVGMSLGNVIASASTLLSTASGSVALTTESNETVKTTNFKVQPMSRQGWWEIR